MGRYKLGKPRKTSASGGSHKAHRVDASRVPITWAIPPWERNEKSTHLATRIVHEGGGRVSFLSEPVRGDNAVEALADLMMGPGMPGSASGLIGVAVRRGIDVKWFAEPPLYAEEISKDEWDVSVYSAGVTLFSLDDVLTLNDRLKKQYRIR